MIHRKPSKARTNDLEVEAVANGKKKKTQLLNGKLQYVYIVLSFLLGAVVCLYSTSSPKEQKNLSDQNSQLDHIPLKPTTEDGDGDVANSQPNISRKAEKVYQDINAKLHSYHATDVQTVGSHEPILSFFLSSILKEDQLLLPEGGILDCGAQWGQQGAHYAVSSPKREVIAMDPSPNNVKIMKDNWGSLPNFDIRTGGLGREVGTAKPIDKEFRMDLNAEFPVYTLDSMYFDKGKKLAFAHLDLEGLEFDVLQGGLKTIRSNNPVFTVELRVHETEKTKLLLDLIASEGYDTYVVDEPCGYPHMDMRNILCIPRKRSVAFGMSDSFNLLLAVSVIIRVTSEDIAQQILPCCALGGECCTGNDLNGEDCCTEPVILEWIDKNKGAYRPPPATIGWKAARKQFHTEHYRLRKRQRTP